MTWSCTEECTKNGRRRPESELCVMNEESSCKPTRHWWPRRLGIVTRWGSDFILAGLPRFLCMIKNVEDRQKGAD